MTTLAGSAGRSGNSDGTGDAARFWNPVGVAVDRNDNVYVADSLNNAIRKITPGGSVTTLAVKNSSGRTTRFNHPMGVAVDKTGNIYVADTDNNIIRKITPNGVATRFAGRGGDNGRGADGEGDKAEFGGPMGWGPQGVAVDEGGNVYVADTGRSTIRKITPDRVVTTIAGFGHPGDSDGIGNAAGFYEPHGVAVDGKGNIYVADCNNHTIRKITSAGVVSTLAGCSDDPGTTDGAGRAARFNGPQGVAVDGSGNVYVTCNFTVRKITQSAGGETANESMKSDSKAPHRMRFPASQEESAATAKTDESASSQTQSGQTPNRLPMAAMSPGTASYTIDIEAQFNAEITQGGNRVMVELRQGVPGTSRVFETKDFEGQTATVSFSHMPAGSYFVAIGNGDSVAVGPVRQFSDGQRAHTRMVVTQSSGNVGTRSLSNL